jgi:hypothetical protein
MVVASNGVPEALNDRTVYTLLLYGVLETVKYFVAPAATKFSSSFSCVIHAVV